MVERAYVAFYYDTSDARCEFYFESCHRAGSKANYDDFVRQLRRRKGNSYLRYVEFDSVSIFLDK